MGTILQALFPATREAVLVCLFREPDRRFFLRELIRTVGRGQGAVQRELGTLATAGIVSREVSGGRVYYQANRGCPIYPELRGLIEKTAGYATKLREPLLKLAGIRVAFVFGSMVRGTAGSESDIDLAVIGTARFRDVVRGIAPTQSALGREVNPIVYSAEELRERAKRGDHFVRELLSADKHFVVGTQDDLDAVAGQQVAG